MSPWDSSAGTAVLTRTLPICMQTDRALLADIPGTKLASKETRKTEREVYASKLSSTKYTANSEVFCLLLKKSQEPQRHKEQVAGHSSYS